MREGFLGDLSEIIQNVVSFVEGNPIIAGLIALILIYFIIRKPKFFFSVLFIALILFGVIYLIINMAASGKIEKEKLIQREEKQIERTQ